jgi:hypothetical protein
MMPMKHRCIPTQQARIWPNECSFGHSPINDVVCLHAIRVRPFPFCILSQHMVPSLYTATTAVNSHNFSVAVSPFTRVRPAFVRVSFLVVDGLS